MGRQKVARAAPPECEKSVLNFKKCKTLRLEPKVKLKSLTGETMLLSVLASSSLYKSVCSSLTAHSHSSSLSSHHTHLSQISSTTTNLLSPPSASLLLLLFLPKAPFILCLSYSSTTLSPLLQPPPLLLLPAEVGCQRCHGDRAVGALAARPAIIMPDNLLLCKRVVHSGNFTLKAFTPFAPCGKTVCT